MLAAMKLRQGSSASVWQLIRALCPHNPPQAGEPLRNPTDDWAALLAGQVLVEATPNVEEEDQEVWQRVRDWQLYLLGSGLPPIERALAGRSLSVLGDPRDFDELISIPVGKFWMGDDDDARAKPKHRVTLPTFKIGKYPVTNAQYARFVQATGRAWASNEADALDRRNHPAWGMTWHDAVAYCAWLTEKWREARHIEAHETVMLPSEAEWERAARFTDGRDYPWGAWQEDHANTTEASIGDTCAVGTFPLGNSVEGCVDLAGNVWEWTRSLWGKEWDKPTYVYPYGPDDPKREDRKADDSVRRVLRGGSFSNHLGNARCAYRNRNRPVDRYDFIGFRVCLRSAPVP